MRHIEVLSFGQPPCGGEIVEQEVAPPKGQDRRHALPVLGAPRRPEREWVCASCGKRWEREPSPGEAL